MAKTNDTLEKQLKKGKTNKILGKQRKILSIILSEYIQARHKHREFKSFHEAYAIMKEELDELWEDIKSKNPNRHINSLYEAIQLSAMAFGFVYEYAENVDVRALSLLVEDVISLKDISELWSKTP